MKNELVTLEDIGAAAMEYYIANIEHFNAKNQRATARHDHLCDADPNSDETPCYYDTRLPFEQWCDNCKYVQPFYLQYIKAARKVAVSKNKLNRLCKTKHWNDAN